MFRYMEDTLVKEKKQTYDLDRGAEFHSTARTESAKGNRGYTGVSPFGYFETGLGALVRGRLLCVGGC